MSGTSRSRDTDRPTTRFLRFARYTEPVLVVVALVGVWQFASGGSRLVDSRALPPPDGIAAALAGHMAREEFWIAVGESVQAWLAGLAIVIVIALPLGVLLGASKVLHGLTALTVEFLRLVPSIAVLPVIVLILGVTFELNLTLVVLAALWPLLIQVMYGMQDVDPVAIETARAFQLGRTAVLLRVKLPSVLPYIGTGLRISGVIAMLVAIAAPLLVGGDGLGGQIARSQQADDVPLTYALVFVTGVLGVLVTVGLTRLEKHLLRWHPSHREVIG